MTYCSNCGNELKEGAKFCDKCGTAVNGGGTGPQHTNINRGTTCQRCGSLVPFGNTACAQCGAPVYKNEHNASAYKRKQGRSQTRNNHDSSGNCNKHYCLYAFLFIHVLCKQNELLLLG